MKNKSLSIIAIFLMCLQIPACSQASNTGAIASPSPSANIAADESGAKTNLPETAEEATTKVTFSTIALDGSPVDSGIFSGSKLTMVNIWATYCGPCIVEMPDIQTLYEEVKGSGVNIMGIVIDAPAELESANEIVSKTGVEYLNIMPDNSIINDILVYVSGVPTTIFVDSEGNITGRVLVGSRGKDEYKSEMEKTLLGLGGSGL
ncbi:MAG: TlpA family protein disulfide reductase [Clostridiales bacterium]|jgi:thiol-disulfide isomerase/thioredoxin|nr:TlpA family protein disulfide reductase [Clostridiales bacterium]